MGSWTSPTSRTACGRFWRPGDRGREAAGPSSTTAPPCAASSSSTCVAACGRAPRGRPFPAARGRPARQPAGGACAIGGKPGSGTGRTGRRPTSWGAQTGSPWERACLDSAGVPARGGRDRPQPDRPRPARRRAPRPDARGVPLAARVGPANRHDSTEFRGHARRGAAHPDPVRAPAPPPGQAPRPQGPRLQAVPGGAARATHQGPPCPSGRRADGAARPPPLGRRGDAGVAEGLSAAGGPPRAARRHPPQAFLTLAGRLVCHRSLPKGL